MMAVPRSIKALESLSNDPPNSDVMPVLFVGHGSPMNAIEENSYTAMWEKIGKELPTPRAILSISAHWLTRNGTKVTAMPTPKTIHDFGGFPEELYAVRYPAPGDPKVAKEVVEAAPARHIALDDDWGFDHGTWSVLKKMYPKANIPVLQLSIDYAMPPSDHYALAQLLKGLRRKGILILGSGNVVHNLRALRMDNVIYDWTKEFDAFIAENIVSGNDQAIVNFQRLGELAKLAHPTYDHLLPLLYTLGVKDASDEVGFFNADLTLGSLSMRSIRYTPR